MKRKGNREHFSTVPERHTFELLANSSPLIKTVTLFYIIDPNFLRRLSHLNDQHFRFSSCSNTNIQQKRGLFNARHLIELSLSCEKGAKQNKRKRMNITKHDQHACCRVGRGISSTFFAFESERCIRCPKAAVLYTSKESFFAIASLERTLQCRCISAMMKFTTRRSDDVMKLCF